MRVIIDHVVGSRRGQRQEFTSEQRLLFGRHPDCDVSFDAHRDLDASSRHAEIFRGEGGMLVLRDIGSSNGTFVKGKRIDELVLESDSFHEVEFGGGGPRLRIVVTQAEHVPAPVGFPGERPSASWKIVALVIVVAATIVVAVSSL